MRESSLILSPSFMEGFESQGTEGFAFLKWWLENLSSCLASAGFVKPQA